MRGTGCRRIASSSPATSTSLRWMAPSRPASLHVQLRGDAQGHTRGGRESAAPVSLGCVLQRLLGAALYLSGARRRECNGTEHLTFEGNDIMYIPRDAGGHHAEDPDHGPPSTASSARSPCLSSQRGAIMRRNSCRNHWESLLNARLSEIRAARARPGRGADRRPLQRAEPVRPATGEYSGPARWPGTSSCWTWWATTRRTGEGSTT